MIKKNFNNKFFCSLLAETTYVVTAVCFQLFVLLQIMPKRSTRASSAIAEKESGPHVRNRHNILMAETRPSTTHTIYPVCRENTLM